MTNLIVALGLLLLFQCNLVVSHLHPDTLVLQYDNTTSPISNIRVGRTIWGLHSDHKNNDTLGILAFQRVAHLIKQEVSEVVEIVTMHNDTQVKIVITTDHLIFELKKGWILSKDLFAGDLLLSISGEQVVVREVHLIHAPNTTVINMEVFYGHTFFISSCYILVHNPKKAAATGKKKGPDEYDITVTKIDEQHDMTEPGNPITHAEYDVQVGTTVEKTKRGDSTDAARTLVKQVEPGMQAGHIAPGLFGIKADVKHEKHGGVDVTMPSDHFPQNPMSNQGIKGHLGDWKNQEADMKKLKSVPGAHARIVYDADDMDNGVPRKVERAYNVDGKDDDIVTIDNPPPGTKPVNDDL